MLQKLYRAKLPQQILNGSKIVFVLGEAPNYCSWRINSQLERVENTTQNEEVLCTRMQGCLSCIPEVCYLTVFEVGHQWDNRKIRVIVH